MLDGTTYITASYSDRCFYVFFFSAFVNRLEIFLRISSNDISNVKALLLLLDHNLLSEYLDDTRREMFNELDTRYVMTLLARRCKVRIT